MPPLTYPRGQRLAGAVQVGHGAGLDLGGDAAGAGQLVQVPEQAEPGDVGGAAGAGGEGGVAGPVVQRRHRVDRLLEALAGRLVPVVEDADAERLGERQRQAGLAGVVAQQAVGVRDAR